MHNTLFHAVLSSYWDISSMADVIQLCPVNILSEYVRPFDCLISDNKEYLIVPKSKCSYLAQKMYESFHIDWCNDVYMKLVNESDFTLDLLYKKLNKWFATKRNLLDCQWNIFTKFINIRPSNVKGKNNTICLHSSDEYLIQKLISELKKRVRVMKVKGYIDRHAYDEFLKHFYDKIELIESLQSSNDTQGNWDFIRSFVLPVMCKVANANLNTFKNKCWLIEKIIKTLVAPKLKHWKSGIEFEVKESIKMYGSEQFINDFNEKFTELLQ